MYRSLPLGRTWEWGIPALSVGLLFDTLPLEGVGLNVINKNKNVK
jgi:hypothetical protein